SWLKLFSKSTEGTANECVCLDTLFFTRLQEGKKDACTRVLEKIDFLKTRLVFVPIHWKHPQFMHWSLVAINLRTFDIDFIDSLDYKETISDRKRI
ncbi:hypothetical protein PENTCL1PPCAC_10829, partial [Pristionchus entomophagus]